MKFQKKKFYLKTNSNFTQLSLNLKKPFLNKISNFRLNNLDQLPMLKSFYREKSSPDKILLTKRKFKKSKFLKSQEKLKILIKEEEDFKKYYLNLIRNKVEDEEKDFNNFLLNSNGFRDNDSFGNTISNNTKTEGKNKIKIEKEIKKVFPKKRNLGKSEIDCNDYLRRFNKLFPGEILEDENEFEKKNQGAIKIQQFFREHKKKIKLYSGFEEPDYLVRIYEHEYDVYPMIKSIEIKIYSKLFEKNVTLFKTIEELLGVSTISREKISKRIDEIIGKIIGFKKVKRKVENSDYYDATKADLSSDDFNDFEEDDD